MHLFYPPELFGPIWSNQVGFSEYLKSTAGHTRSSPALLVLSPLFPLLSHSAIKVLLLLGQWWERNSSLNALTTSHINNGYFPRSSVSQLHVLQLGCKYTKSEILRYTYRPTDYTTNTIAGVLVFLINVFLLIQLCTLYI